MARLSYHVLQKPLEGALLKTFHEVSSIETFCKRWHLQFFNALLLLILHSLFNQLSKTFVLFSLF